MKPTDRDSGLTHDRLCAVLGIYPETGDIIWKEWRGGYASKGTQAGALTQGKYISVKIDGRLYLAHRLIWFYVFGRWPKDQIDHKNLDKLDNRISNLRESSQAENIINGRVRPDNVSGLRGVTKHGDGVGYIARIGLNKDRKYLGYFYTAQAAHQAYCEASRRLHGEFSRTA